jgi:hypothetical protein
MKILTPITQITRITHYSLPYKLRRFFRNSSWYDLPTGTS